MSYTKLFSWKKRRGRGKLSLKHSGYEFENAEPLSPDTSIRLRQR